jgi:transcriptional regulator with XRE-family HTH domain
MADVAQLTQRFGRLVAAHRKRMGLTQVELSERTGISLDMIRRIEGGGTGVRFPNIQRLADALAVDPAELFSGLLSDSKLNRPILNRLVARLAAQSDADLELIAELIEVALKSRR